MSNKLVWHSCWESGAGNVTFPNSIFPIPTYFKTDMSALPYLASQTKTDWNLQKKNGEARSGGLSCTLPVTTYGKKKKLEEEEWSVG